MGIGMKTKRDNSSPQGTLNQAPKTQSKTQPRKSTGASNTIQNKPQKRKNVSTTYNTSKQSVHSKGNVSDAQWHSVNNAKQQRVRHSAEYTEPPYEEAEDFTTQVKEKKTNKKPIILVAVIAIVMLAFCSFYYFSQVNSSKNKSVGKTPNTPQIISQESDTEDESEDAPEEGTTLENGFETGDSNSEGGKYEEGTLTKTTSEHYSSSDFLKDLNGYEIPAVYTVQNVTYDVAHVNYQAKRATIDDGMEFYWLEIDYNGKKYRAQCSYNMFRNLESEGICKVAVEILTLDSGQQVVSYMKVVSEDYTVDDAENDYNF